jgi:hypothetical protein
MSMALNSLPSAAFADRLERIEKVVDYGGGGSNNGGMEARVAKLEAAVEYIQRDIAEIKSGLEKLREKVDSHFLILGGMIIATALGLAGLMAKGFGWL